MSDSASARNLDLKVETGWLTVCSIEEIAPDTGVCAFVEGEQIAIVRVGDGLQFHAVSNFDPYSRAFVISRGIVGDSGGVPKISSPIFKQAFDLKTGACLGDPNVVLPTYPVRVNGTNIQVYRTARNR